MQELVDPVVVIPATRAIRNVGHKGSDLCQTVTQDTPIGSAQSLGVECREFSGNGIRHVHKLSVSLFWALRFETCAYRHKPK